MGIQPLAEAHKPLKLLSSWGWPMMALKVYNGCMATLRLRPILPKDFFKIHQLSNAAFGDNYITVPDLQRQWPMMHSEKTSASFLLESTPSKEILGFRITYLPGVWFHEKEGKKSLTEKWTTDPSLVAYFKTALVDPSLRGHGWGRTMANASIDAVKHLGAKAIVTHSWNESPGDSSGKYLRALGFYPIGKIKNFWGETEYDCVECNNSPCTCTATEMMLDIYA